MFRHAIAPRRFFLQVPNDIIRHPRLGSDAKALLLYVLSLPEAADWPLQRSAERAGLKKAAFTAAKRQLLAEGYVHEWREQGPGGRWTTEQLISNTPLSREEAERARRGEPVREALAEPVAEVPAPRGRKPAAGEPGGRAVGGSQEPHPVGKTPNRPPSPPEPEAVQASLPQEPELVRLAGAVLAAVSHGEPRLRLGGRDIARLAPLGAEWLVRGCPPGAMRLALTTGLPAEPVHNPAGFLRDRLRRKMPSPAAVEAPKALVVAAALECDDCRAPLPRGHQGGVCKPCAVAGPEPEPTRSGLAAVRAALGGGLAAAFAMP